MLGHELNAGYFDITHSQNKKFFFLEPKTNLTGQPQLDHSSNDVDFAYGPKDDNQKVYDEMVVPLIDLSL